MINKVWSCYQAYAMHDADIQQPALPGAVRLTHSHHPANMHGARILPCKQVHKQPHIIPVGGGRYSWMKAQHCYHATLGIPYHQLHVCMAQRHSCKHCARQQSCSSCLAFQLACCTGVRSAHAQRPPVGEVLCMAAHASAALHSIHATRCVFIPVQQARCTACTHMSCSCGSLTARLIIT
jgi:hypothetical protein